MGNNGPSQQSYAEELAQDPSLIGQGTSGSHYRYGKPVASADFDQNYQPINRTYPGSTPASYTVKSGDTLRSIAQAAWGDGSLWYLIAEANGLNASSTLSAGQILILPNKVTNLHNNSSTYRVYDAGAAIGDTMPTLPPEPAPPPPPQQQSGKSGGCGGFGAVIAIVVAVVVTYITAGAALSAMGTTFAQASLGQAVAAGAIGGAAGSIASQAVSIAMGNQDSFSWKGVALGAMGGAVTGGLASGTVAGSALGNSLNSSLGSFGAGVVRGAIGSVVTQGIGVVTGLQQSFNWRGVAASAIAQGTGAQVTEWMGNPASWQTQATSGLATGIASAAVRGGSVKQALPGILQDVIANTIGNQIAGSLAQSNSPYALAQGPAQPIGLKAAPELIGSLGWNSDNGAAANWNPGAAYDPTSADQALQARQVQDAIKRTGSNDLATQALQLIQSGGVRDLFEADRMAERSSRFNDQGFDPGPFHISDATTGNRDVLRVDRDNTDWIAEKRSAAQDYYAQQQDQAVQQGGILGYGQYLGAHLADLSAQVGYTSMETARSTYQLATNPQARQQAYAGLAYVATHPLQVAQAVQVGISNWTQKPFADQADDLFKGTLSLAAGGFTSKLVQGAVTPVLRAGKWTVATGYDKAQDFAVKTWLRSQSEEVLGGTWQQVYESANDGTRRLGFSLRGDVGYRAADNLDLARLGRFLSLEQPSSPTNAIKYNALLPDWGGNASHLYEVKTRPGFYFKGTTAPQYSQLLDQTLPGGNTQIFQPKVFGFDANGNRIPLPTWNSTKALPW